jgi:hypothetical protein
MKKFLLLLLFVFIAISCEIKLDGNRFYAVEGRLIDTLYQPIVGHELKVISSFHSDFIYDESVVLNKGITDTNGYFKIYFPGSNARTYLIFEPEFYKYDSISAEGHIYGYYAEIKLSDENYPENHVDLGYLKIKKNN